MKPESVVASLALVTLIALSSGCENKETSPANPTGKSSAETATNVLSSAAAEVKQVAENATAAVKETTQQVTAQIKETTQNVTAATTSKVEALKAEATSLIDKTKSFINDKRYEDAMNSLKQLSNFTLTPEQQKTVDDLKEQLQKLMSSSVVTNAASTLDSFLKK